MFIDRIVRSVVLVGIALSFTACGKSKSDSSAGAAGSGGGPGLTAVEQEARDAAFAEIAKHFQKGPDGWTTAVTSGSAYAPEYFLRQFRDIEIDEFQSKDLDDSDKLNGVEWKGFVTFKNPSCREVGEPGPTYGGMGGVNRQRGQWSDWFAVTPEGFSETKTKGKWDVYPNSVLLRGELPTPKDYARAGLK